MVEAAMQPSRMVLVYGTQTPPRSLVRG